MFEGEVDFTPEEGQPINLIIGNLLPSQQELIVDGRFTKPFVRIIDLMIR